MSTLLGLQCHVCHTAFPAEATYVCDQCFGPLEPVYDYEKAAATFTRENIASRPRNIWRYRELLPITGEPLTGFGSGFTPLVPAPRLAERLGVRELYIKDDGVNHPTLSYKDRVVSVAATRAVELGFTTFACASTGNLGNSVAAHAARLGLRCFVFIPDDLEPYKVLGSAIYHPTLLAVRGNYDEVNRLCAEVADYYEAVLIESDLQWSIEGDASGLYDAALLRRVLSNLLNNAARYADPGSSIVIRIVVETHGHIKLSVINRGEPISAESLPHIFDRFFRVDASRSHGHQNHGLGLAIVGAIARMHDGEAFAKSAHGETEIGVRLAG